MRILSRPDCVGFPYTRACMYNLILDEDIYIYHQTKYTVQSYSKGGHEYLVYNFLLLSFTYSLGSNHEVVISIMIDIRLILELLLDELPFIVLISLLNASQYYQWQFLWFIIYYKIANIEHFFLDQTELRRGEN